MSEAIPRRMTRAIPLLLVLLVAAGPATGTEGKAAAAAQPPPSAEAFLQMRQAYASSPGYDPDWESNPERAAVIKAYSERDSKAFLNGSEEWLKKCPVDAEVHLMRAMALLAHGDYAAQLYHRFMYFGLMASITITGKGTSMGSPFNAISPTEEHALLDQVGAEYAGETPQIKGGKTFDIVQATLDDQRVYFYFDVTLMEKAREAKKAAAKKS